jgi:hypothetical protein
MTERTKSVEQTIKDIVIGIMHCDESALILSTTWKDLEADLLDLVQMLVVLEEIHTVLKFLMRMSRTLLTSANS